MSAPHLSHVIWWIRHARRGLWSSGYTQSPVVTHGIVFLHHAPNHFEFIVDKDNTIKIPVIEEQLSVAKEWRETGSLHVKKTIQESKQPIDATLLQETYSIERIPKNIRVEGNPDPVRHEGDRIIISVFEERPVVEKQLFLVEEVHVIRQQAPTEFRDEVTIKKEVVDVERKPASRG